MDKKNRLKKTNPNKAEKGLAFTLIELVVVISLMGLVMLAAGYNSGAFAFWREEDFLRRFTKTIDFLYSQAIADQAFYRLELHFGEEPTFSAGAIRPEETSSTNLTSLNSEDVGILSVELANFTSPAPGVDGTYTIIPPPTFPSLAVPERFPGGVKLERVRLANSILTPETDELAPIVFSPRGFADFSVISLRLSSGAPITILVNPFTGQSELYREEKDFEWTYGDNRSHSSTAAGTGP